MSEPIAGWTEEQLAEYIRRIVKGDASEQHTGMFQATVVVVTADINGGFLVDVLSEGQPTGGQTIRLSCKVAGFTPVANDLVECMWRDPAVGYVLWKVK